MGNPAFLPSEAVFKIWAIPWFNLWKQPLFASPAVKKNVDLNSTEASKCQG